MENDKIIIYQTEDGQTQIDVRLENETVWLNTNQMALLFEREDSNIRRHIINVFKDGELEKDNNVHFLHVNGIKKPVPFYNLDVIPPPPISSCRCRCHPQWPAVHQPATQSR